MNARELLLFLVGAVVWLSCIAYGIRNLKRANYSPHWMWFALLGLPGAIIVFIVSLCLAPMRRHLEELQQALQRVKQRRSDHEGSAASTEIAGVAIARQTNQGEVGKIYRGKVVAIEELGCCVEFLPGKNGFCHISELADHNVRQTEHVVLLGDDISVKCLGTDEKGHVRLSRKAAMAERDRHLDEELQRADSTCLPAEGRQATERAVRPPAVIPAIPTESSHGSEEGKTWQRRKAERLYEEGVTLIQKGWNEKDRDTVADGLEKLEASISADAFFMEPWILTLKTLYRALGRSKLDEMMRMQRLFSAPGELEKTRILQDILDHLDDTGSFPLFPEMEITAGNEKRKHAAIEAYNSAMELFQAGQKEESDQLLARALDLDPDHLEACIAMTYAATEKGNHNEAIMRAMHAAQLRPGYGDAVDALFTAYANRGMQQLKLKQSPVAFDSFRLALLASPDHEEAQNIFNCLWITESSARDEFIGICGHLLELNTNKTYVRLKLGRALINAHRFSEALSHLEECCHRDAFNAEAQQWLCVAYASNRLKEKAKEQYERLKALSLERAVAIADLMTFIDDDRDDLPDLGDRSVGRN